jgi:predicted RNase H-like nuclease (RuvC/YqgF family)
MMDENMEFLQKRVQQAIGLIERLKEENQNLKNQLARMQDEIQQLKEEANALREERELIKGKIDTAVSMLDKVDLDDVLESIAEEVAEEAAEETDTTPEGNSGDE